MTTNMIFHVGLEEWKIVQCYARATTAVFTSGLICRELALGKKDFSFSGFVSKLSMDEARSILVFWSKIRKHILSWVIWISFSSVGVAERILFTWLPARKDNLNSLDGYRPEGIEFWRTVLEPFVCAAAASWFETSDEVQETRFISFIIF